MHQQNEPHLNLDDLESFYRETDIGLSLNKKMVISCPMICLFCEHFIYEPLTLYCGHTFCENCILKSEFRSIKKCPRCTKDVQGHIPSSIDYARSKSFNKNHFLNEIFDRSQTLKYIRQNSSLCCQAEAEFEKENYQRALEIFSMILENFDDHYAAYGRAKTYVALKEFEKALTDIERTITIKPQWIKGHYLRSEIFFELKKHTAALLSSLHGLAFNPDDSHGKQLISKYLQAVLSESNEHEIERDLKFFSETTLDNKENSNTTEINDNQLNLCKSKSTSCFCSLFDVKILRTRDFDCSICANLLWFPVTTPCGHLFCRECLIRSIDNTQALCPMCKYQLDEFFSMLVQSHVNQTEIIAEMIESFFPKEYDERRRVFEEDNILSTSIPKDLNDANETSIFEIPIFVCVLALPHSTCPLHVFEPRYRLMMRRTIETNSRTFGMCKYDENTDTFADYGTLLYIRGLIYTEDGRSIVDTVGQRRFRVVERDRRDGYDTARVQLIRDHPIDNETEFNELHQMNRNTYERVREWFNQLDLYRRTLISRQFENYPTCDDLTQESVDGPVWAWIMLNVLPIEPDLQYNVLMSQSFRVRLRVINETIDFLLNYHRQQRQHHHHHNHHHQQQQQQNHGESQQIQVQSQPQQTTEEESTITAVTSTNSV